uniref:Golgin A7 family member B n=1 Tax=Rousettus aegyptiacus TaxID=9407 RepID=A0A7J8G7V8_ROUAE|nr:golgin A7 family member B [Rousettus aegyptiacus]
MATEVHNLQELRRSASLATKVFIQRDYSDGTICQFQTKFPPELDSRIERQLFEEMVKTLNSFYAEAEKIGGSSYLEGCLACATAYFIFLCMETHYEKVLKKISRYIQEQNEKIFAPRGLLLTDPVERGMRVRIPILHDFSPQIPGPPGLSPFEVLLPIAVFQCLYFLMLPRGICLSMILHPRNLRSGETSGPTMGAMVESYSAPA